MLTAVNATDYSMRLKPTDLIDLKADTVKRAIDTIGNRIEQLGWPRNPCSSMARPAPSTQILVQLPGVDDPARVKELIGTTAVLEIDDVKEGPFPSREAALAQKGGVLPLNTKLVRSKPRGTGEGEQWYLVSKNPVITGRDMRNARAGQDEFRKWETSFTLSQDGGQALRPLHGSQHRQQPGRGPGQPDRQRRTIQTKIEDSGRITGLGSEEESCRSVALPAVRVAAGRRDL